MEGQDAGMDDATRALGNMVASRLIPFLVEYERRQSRSESEVATFTRISRLAEKWQEPCLLALSESLLTNEEVPVYEDSVHRVTAQGGVFIIGRKVRAYIALYCGVYFPIADFSVQMRIRRWSGRDIFLHDSPYVSPIFPHPIVDPARGYVDIDRCSDDLHCLAEGPLPQGMVKFLNDVRIMIQKGYRMGSALGGYFGDKPISESEAEATGRSIYKFRKNGQ